MGLRPPSGPRQVMRRPGSAEPGAGWLLRLRRPRPGTPTPPGGARSRDPRGGKACEYATQRVGRKGQSVRLSGGAGPQADEDDRGGGAGGRSPTSSLPAEGPTRASRPPHIRVSWRHSAASAAAAAAAASSPAAQKRQTSGDDGDASPVRWELHQRLGRACATPLLPPGTAR